MFDKQSYEQCLVQVYDNGDAIWAPGGVYYSSCQLNMRIYPFDSQTCDLVFSSWTYPNTSMQLYNDSERVDVSKYSSDGEWELTSTEVFRHALVYDNTSNEDYPAVTFRLHLRRKPMYYIVNIIGPCMLMSLLEALVFLLPPDSGEKVALGITVLLSFSVFLLLVADNVPHTSDSMPLIGRFM